MPTNFPTSLDNGTSLPNPAAANNTNSPSLSGQQSVQNDALKAIEAKIGIGASTPVVSRLLFGTGTGTSAWTQLTSAQLLASLTDETGTGSAVFATTPTLVTPKVDTINENTPANGVTIDGLNIKDNALNTSSSVPTAALQDSSVTSAKVATGACVQMVNVLASTLATGTTIIPQDNTIPQNTEGDQYMTLTITPKSATNVLVITSIVSVSSSIAAWLISALFQDSAANALAVDAIYQATALGGVCNTVTHTMVAGTTSPTTFKIRSGANGAGTTYFNGSLVQQYGATTKSSMIITEYKA